VPKTRKIVIGTCKLCLKEGVRLQASHFLPQGIYKALRGNERHGNPNPVLLTPHEAKQTSMQVKAHLLCSPCEGRLGRNGEDWVMRNGLRNDGRFKLLTALYKYSPKFDASGTAAIFRAATMPEVSVTALTYFAASIFWRGSIHPWKADGKRPVPLGPYEEPLRRYLMGEIGFPEDMMLSVVVRMPSQISGFTYGPVGEWRGTQFIAKFPMPGLAFSISAGPDIAKPMRDLCFVRGENNPLAFTGALEQYILEDGVKMYERIPPTKRNLSLGVFDKTSNY
jgi:hypothetical protein